jgi:hypothetical protein
MRVLNPSGGQINQILNRWAKNASCPESKVQNGDEIISHHQNHSYENFYDDQSFSSINPAQLGFNYIVLEEDQKATIDSLCKRAIKKRYPNCCLNDSEKSRKARSE